MTFSAVLGRVFSCCPHEVVVKAQLFFSSLKWQLRCSWNPAGSMHLSQRGQLPVQRCVCVRRRAVQCWRAVPHRVFSRHAGSGSLQEAGKNNMAGLCSFPTLPSWWLLFNMKTSINVLNSLNGFPFFFFPPKLIGFTMLNINKFHNLICSKNQFILWFPKPAAQ